jgi:hypothetical protein
MAPVRRPVILQTATLQPNHVNTVVYVDDNRGVQADDCVFCTLTPEQAVKQLVAFLKAKRPHAICAGCADAMSNEIVNQLNRDRS